MLNKTMLEGQVAIITGASRGIGRATALMLAQAGAAVVLAARSGQDIQTLAEEIKANGGQALAIPTDVTSKTDVDWLLTSTMRAFKRVDILVNNAAVLQPVGKIWEVNVNDWQKLLQINVIGPFLCARAVLPHMVERGTGRIINISSGAANGNTPGWSAYCTSKAALNRFSGVLAAEVAHTDIEVSVVGPGTTDTAMQAEIREVDQNAFSRVDYFRQLHATGQLYLPEEPAQLIVWLASDYGQGHNGAILNLDDATLREKLAQDLGLPPIPTRRVT